METFQKSQSYSLPWMLRLSAQNNNEASISSARRISQLDADNLTRVTAREHLR